MRALRLRRAGEVQAVMACYLCGGDGAAAVASLTSFSYMELPLKRSGALIILGFAAAQTTSLCFLVS